MGKMDNGYFIVRIEAVSILEGEKIVKKLLKTNQILQRLL